MLNRIDLSRADLNLLVLFEAVLEEGHVGRAAGRLHLTPSAVSHGLGRLRRLLNDPLFLRTPRGMVPTARAVDLAAPVADVLARARSVIASAAPFDPATSARRFAIGAPDGVSAVFLPALLAALARPAPAIAIGVRQLVPVAGESAPERAWQGALAELEARALDLAVIPQDRFPARFLALPLYAEDFVIAMRAEHKLAGGMTVQEYCSARHLVVSPGGDPHGFVDALMAGHGLSRRVALTVPGFFFALAVLAESDLVAALPRRFVAMHGTRFGVVAQQPPLPLPGFRLHAVATGAGMMDAGMAWLVDQLTAACEAIAAPAPARAADHEAVPRFHPNV